MIAKERNMCRKRLHLAAGLFVLTACGPANSASLVSIQKLPWATAEKLASEAVRICEGRGYSVAAAVAAAKLKGDLE